jgi:hypothetical protein
MKHRELTLIVYISLSSLTQLMQLGLSWRRRVSLERCRKRG